MNEHSPTKKGSCPWLQGSIRLLFSLLVPVACIAVSACRDGPPDLSLLACEAESITVYDLEGRGRPDYSAQDLEEASRASFDMALFRALAPHARFERGRPVWKGSRLAIVKMKNGTERQLALSLYGNFFKVLGERGYFYFEGNAADRFEKAFIDEILFGESIPKRQE